MAITVTTWNPSDKSTQVNLSGGNLVMTANAANASGGARTIATMVSTKLYFEVTLTTLAGGAAYIGIATSAPAIGNGSPNNTGNAVIANSTGATYINGSITGANLGVIAVGSTVCVAADLNALLIWWRTSAAGIWNGSASNDPATGVGGRSLAAAFNVGTPAYGYAIFQLVPNGSAVTANFGNSPFLGSVPGGYGASSAQSRAMILA